MNILEKIGIKNSENGYYFYKIPLHLKQGPLMNYLLYNDKIDLWYYEKNKFEKDIEKTIDNKFHLYQVLLYGSHFDKINF